MGSVLYIVSSEQCTAGVLEDDIFCDGIYYSVSFWLSLVSGARSAIRPTHTHTYNMENGNGFGNRNEGAVVPASQPAAIPPLIYPPPPFRTPSHSPSTIVYVPTTPTQFIPIELEVEIVYRSILCAGLLSSSKSKTRSLSALLFIIINKLFVYENNKYKQKARQRIRDKSTRWCGPIVNGN